MAGTLQREATLASYEWVQGRPGARLADGCLSVVTGASASTALATLGSTEPAILSCGEAKFSIAAVTVPTGTVTFETQSYRAARPEIMAQLSQAGRAVSVARCEGLEMRITLAEGGRILASFDPRQEGDWLEQPQNLIGTLLGDLERAPRGDEAWMAAGLLLAERFTGIRITQEVLAELKVTHDSSVA